MCQTAAGGLHTGRDPRAVPRPRPFRRPRHSALPWSPQPAPAAVAVSGGWTEEGGAAWGLCPPTRVIPQTRLRKRQNRPGCWGVAVTVGRVTGTECPSTAGTATCTLTPTPGAGGAPRCWEAGAPRGTSHVITPEGGGRDASLVSNSLARRPPPARTRFHQRVRPEAPRPRPHGPLGAGLIQEESLCPRLPGTTVTAPRLQRGRDTRNWAIPSEDSARAASACVSPVRP